jgi:hypothetical protein
LDGVTVTNPDPAQAGYADHEELRKKLLEINVWAMTLVLALILERASDSVVFIAGTQRPIDIKVWAALVVITLAFAALLGTTVGVLVLHVRFRAPYNYWYVVLDNIFLTVPLYLAVRFLAASTLGGGSSAVSGPLTLDESEFRIGNALIALSYVFLFARDLYTLPKIRDKVTSFPLAVFSMLHVLGAILFALVAIVPDLVVYVVVLCVVGFAFFFTGMAATPFLERRYAAHAIPTPSPVSGQAAI